MGKFPTWLHQIDSIKYEIAYRLRDDAIVHPIRTIFLAEHWNFFHRCLKIYFDYVCEISNVF